MGRRENTKGIITVVTLQFIKSKNLRIKGDISTIFLNINTTHCIEVKGINLYML